MNVFKDITLYSSLSLQDTLNCISRSIPFKRLEDDEGLVYENRQEQSGIHFFPGSNLTESSLTCLQTNPCYTRFRALCDFIPLSQFVSRDGEFFKEESRIHDLTSILSQEGISYFITLSSKSLDYYAKRGRNFNFYFMHGYTPEKGIVFMKDF